MAKSKSTAAPAEVPAEKSAVTVPVSNDARQKNPLIGATVGDTLDNVAAVTTFIQQAVCLRSARGPLCDEAVTGLYFVLQCVWDAVQRQNAALAPSEEASHV